MQVNNAVAVGPTSDFGEISRSPTTGRTRASARRAAGSSCARSDFNPERISSTTCSHRLPSVDVGDRFTGRGAGAWWTTTSATSSSSTSTALDARWTAACSGRPPRPPMPSSSRSATLQRREPRPGRSAGEVPARSARRSSATCARPTSSRSRRSRTTTGPTNDATTDATATYSALIAAIQAGRRPGVRVPPDRPGRRPGRRRAGRQHPRRLPLPHRSRPVVRRPRRAGRRSARPRCSGAGRRPAARSPGRIDPTNPAFNSSRKPLAGEFRFRGRTLFVIANHFNSKGGDQPLFGRFQPPQRSSETQRHQQAEIVNGFVGSILAADTHGERRRARRPQRLRVLRDARHPQGRRAART